MSNVRMTLTPEEVRLVKKLRKEEAERLKWVEAGKAREAKQAACKHSKTEHTANCRGWMRDDSSCHVVCTQCDKILRTCVQGY